MADLIYDLFALSPRIQQSLSAPISYRK